MVSSVKATQMSDDRLTNPSQVVVIERRLLFRELLVGALKAFVPNVHAFASSEEWRTKDTRGQTDVIVLSISDSKPAEDMCRGITTLAKLAAGVPIVVYSNSADADLVVRAVEAGASGFVSTDLTFAVFYEALRLVKAGGTFVPAGSLVLGSKLYSRHGGRDRPTNDRMFTRRQAAVIDALRKGKSNKIIAYELNMCESTVKVHVRNIMKRLHAKNRTEVAYLIQLHPDFDH